uniref:DDE-1 domain-containing protein n=1 Tax=Esox lucius TaxID=8010 RepID=A0A6Q2Y1E7_ESOLU
MLQVFLGLPCVVYSKTRYVEFLPKNTTPLLQPCDQGIIRTAQAYFRKDMARTALHQIDEVSRDTATVITNKICLLYQEVWSRHHRRNRKMLIHLPR